MGTVIWRGGASAVAQITTITPENPQAGDVFTVTVNGKSITYTVTAANMTAGDTEAGVVALVVDGLVAAFNASTIAEFIEITASDSTTHMTLTADTAGRTFIATATSTNDGSAADEVQTVTLTGASSGNITWTFAGITTGNIAFDADATAWNTALDAAFGAGEIVATGGPLNTNPITLTFSGATYDDTNVSQGTAADVDLDAGTLTTATTTQGSAGADDVTAATTTANAGPNDWSTAKSWDTSAVPVSTDDAILTDSEVDILHGLAQSAVALTSLTIDQSFEAKLGLLAYNEDDAANPYEEYRQRSLAIGATTITVGAGDGAGSGRLMIDNGSVQTTLSVLNTGSPESDTRESLLWKGTHASNVVNVSRGSVGIAALGGEVATVATLRVSYVDSLEDDARVRCGPGVTLGAVEKDGGTLEINSGTTTFVQSGGETSIMAGAHASLIVDDGTVNYRSAGTATAVIIGNNGVVDCSQDLRPRTFTNCTMYPGATLRDPHKTITFTNGIDLVRCGIQDVTLEIGEDYTLTPSAI